MRVAVAQIEPKLGEKERQLRSLSGSPGGGSRCRCDSCSCCPSARSPATCSRASTRRCRMPRRFPGPSSEALEDACRRLGMHVACGLLERDGDVLHNAAVLVGPDGLVGTYRKSHLPFLGVDRFVTPGDELPVWDTPLGRIGVEICYDLRFPEVTRSLALQGADIVVHPTNFPMAAKIQTELITVARAAENRIFLLTANRVGKERWAEFCGWSQIVDPYGVRLAEAGRDGGGAARRGHRRRESPRQGLRHPGRVRALPLRPPSARALRRPRRRDEARRHADRRPTRTSRAPA